MLLEVMCMFRSIAPTLRRQCTILILGLFVLGASLLPAAGDELPEVVRPNTALYSEQDIAVLLQATTVLEETLNADLFLSSPGLVPTDWKGSDLAGYTAGFLAEQGYETYLVSGVGWPDGVHTWVLVRIPVDESTAWIPVEPLPDKDGNQETLGYIPSYVDGEGVLWFEEEYFTFSERREPPKNRAPIARFRPPNPPVKPQRTVMFRAIGSYDSDGKIVLYHWDFGDGATDTATEQFSAHKFTKSGTYSVSLTVVDNGGIRATTTAAIRVARSGEPKGGDECIPCGK